LPAIVGGKLTSFADNLRGSGFSAVIRVLLVGYGQNPPAST
jgi:hypothetical protein